MVAEAEAQQKAAALHVLFVPLMAHGHMIPLFDIARLFAARGVKATVVTTPANAPVFSESLSVTKSNNKIDLEIIPFPSEEAGLPAGFENFELVTGNDVLDRFVEGLRLLETPVERVVERLRPSCIVSDMFLPWTADVAERQGVPRVGFSGRGYFGTSVVEAMSKLRPFEWVEDEDDEFVVPGLPGREVRLTRRKMAPQWKGAQDTSPVMKVMKAALEAEKRSYGVIMNSFDELEPDYARHYRNLMPGRRAWSVGPVSLCNRDIEDKAKRGKKAAIDEHECLRWLDSKPPDSVVYICFGSITNMSTPQLCQIALALESSLHNFIWVVRRPADAEEEEWLPSGFEDRTRGRGLVIRGWAPQVMILDHVATGTFLTHCGWNSTLEGISAGVNMVTWPVFAEQFINEKLITEVLRVGVSVGAKEYFSRVVEVASVGREAVEEAVRRAMGAEEMRGRAAQLKEMARKAVREGGSSYEGLTHLLMELA